jgi:hypothetical protein
VSLVGEKAAISFEVVARPAEIAEFAASLGADPASPRPPTTFPIRWLTRPEVVAVVKALAADKPASLPVHELQTVETLGALAINVPLTLALTAERSDDIHVTVEAQVFDAASLDAASRPLVKLHSILRLVP